MQVSVSWGSSLDVEVSWSTMGSSIGDELLAVARSTPGKNGHAAVEPELSIFQKNLPDIV